MMKGRVFVIICSVMLALVIMSGGYGIWTKQITIIGDIEVIPEPVKQQATTQGVTLENGLELEPSNEAVVTEPLIEDAGKETIVIDPIIGNQNPIEDTEGEPITIDPIAGDQNLIENISKAPVVVVEDEEKDEPEKMEAQENSSPTVETSENQEDSSHIVNESTENLSEEKGTE